MEINQEKSVQLSRPNQLISETELIFADKIESILSLTRDITIQSNPIARALMQANAMEKITELLTPELMRPVEKLFGSAMGIKVDSPSYTPELKKRIFMEAVLGGWGITGNQINVIGGNMYVTKNGYLPRLRSFPGLKFNFPFKHSLPVQDKTNLTWTVETEMIWEINGVKHREIIVNPTKKQEGQSADALWGKADTKCCRWLWNKVTGEDTMDDSAIDIESEDVTNSEKEVKKEKIVKSEEIPIMVSSELQSLFDSYISKENNSELIAKSKEELIQRAKVWCDSKKAKDSGVVYSINNDGIFESPSLNLNKFIEIYSKF